MPMVPVSRLLPSVRRTVLGRLSPDRTDGQLLTAFVTERDPEAFAGLVRRHGSMILGVCRRIVGDVHAAEDAFQAAFIVLARRAASIKSREQVANWLYGVAYRTAMKARTVLARRRSREKQVEAMPEPTGKAPADVWADLQPIIDEELNRLPDKLRLPVVLCDLEGRPQRAVAAQLKLPPATLATRLATARRTLAVRLTKRGIALSGGALAGLLGDRAAAALVPPALAESVQQTAEAIALGISTSPLASASAVHISEGVMRMMLVAKLKTFAAAVLSVLVLTGGFGFGLMPAQAFDEPTLRVVAVKQPDTKPQPAPKRMSDGEFLNRLCLDLRGTPATLLERLLFEGDADPNKRAKVVEWVLADDGVKPFLAKQFSVGVESVRAVKVVELGDGKLTVIVTLNPDAKALAFSPDGKYLAVEEPVRVRLTVAPEPEVQALLFVDGQEKGIVNEKYAEIVEFGLKGQEPARSTVRLWDLTTGKQLELKKRTLNSYWADDLSNSLVVTDDPVVIWSYLAIDDSDVAFLRRAVTFARGTPPTAIEERYFTEDKDSKKREKLLDALLKDPSVQKKVGDDWKKQMLAPPAAAPTVVESYSYRSVLKGRVHDRALSVTLKPNDPTNERLTKLVDELLAAKKPDDQVLDGLALTMLGRLPTQSEKSLTLTSIAKTSDRRAAWLEVAKVLAGTDEGKRHSESLKSPAIVPPARP